MKESTKNKVYKEHSVKWMDLPEVGATWVVESDFKKLGINKEFLSPVVP